VKRTRTPKRPRLNTSLSVQASVWHTPEALSRRQTIATLLQNAYVNTDSLHASIVSLLAPLVQEWVFTVKRHMPGKKKDKMWLEMMERIRTCCVFEVRNFKGHALQMGSIGCKLPRVVVLLARSTDEQQHASLQHFEKCVQCGCSLATMSNILRFLNRNPANGIPCQGVGANSLQLAEASSSRETKKVERAAKLAEWQSKVQKPAVLDLREEFKKKFKMLPNALSDNPFPEEAQVEDMSLYLRELPKKSYFRQLTNEAAKFWDVGSKPVRVQLFTTRVSYKHNCKDGPTVPCRARS
jgi:hypothetical protein